jgi:hypothetical protein
MNIERVPIETPADANLIAGQTHFIKTVEDLYEVFANSVPGIEFGLAFCEASADRLIRWDGNDQELARAAVEATQAVGAGHFFAAFIRKAFPINVLPAIKLCPEIVAVFCATANPVEMLVVGEGERRGVIGVLDGLTPLGVEEEDDKARRRSLLRKIGYKPE